MSKKIIKYLLAATLLSGFAGITTAGIPLYLGFLSLSAIFVLARRTAQHTPPWLHVALMASVALGILPLAPPDFANGVKEVIQYVAVFGIAFVVFAGTDDSERLFVTRLLAYTGIFLLAGNGLLRLLAPGFYSDARLAFLLAITLPFVCVEIVRLRKSLPGIPLALAAFIISVNNGGLLLCGLLGAALTIYLHQRDQSKEPLLFVALVLIAFLPQTSAWQTLQPRWNDGTLKRVFIELEATPNAIQRSPLMGHGLGRYRTVIRPFFQRFPQAHDQTIMPDTNSQVALLAVEAGIIPPTLLIVLLITTLFKTVNLARQDRYAAPLAGAATVILGGGLFSVIINRHTGIGVGAVLGMATAAAWTAKMRLSADKALPAQPNGTEPAKQAAPPVESGRSLAFWRELAPKAAITAQIPLLCILLAWSGVMLRHPQQQLEIIGAAQFDGYDYVVLNAHEPDNQLRGSMRLVDADMASANRALAVPAGAGKDGATAHFTFRNITEGDHYIWVRALWEDSCSNSIGCILDNEDILLTSEIYGKWHWISSPRTVNLRGGDVALQVRNTEDGVMIDQILLTPDKRFVPHGILKNAGSAPRP